MLNDFDETKPLDDVIRTLDGKSAYGYISAEISEKMGTPAAPIILTKV